MNWNLEQVRSTWTPLNKKSCFPISQTQLQFFLCFPISLLSFSWIPFLPSRLPWCSLPATLSAVSLRASSLPEPEAAAATCPSPAPSPAMAPTATSKGLSTWTAPFQAPPTSLSNASPHAPTTCAATSSSPSIPAATTVLRTPSLSFSCINIGWDHRCIFFFFLHVVIDSYFNCNS